MCNTKTISTIIVILSSGSIFASTTTPILSKFITQNWEFGGRALYFKPNVNSDNAVQYSTGDVEAASFIKNPRWGFGFMLEGSYNINSTNNINLNWYHITSNTNTNLHGYSISIPSSFNTSLIDSLENDFFTSKFDDTEYKISPKWNMVNLEFGKNITFSQYNAIRIHSGIEFANLSSQNFLSVIGSVTTQSNLTTSLNSTITNYNSYSGFGPRLGVDMNAISEKNFELYAKGAIALLVGPNKYHEITADNILSITTTVKDSTTSIVPEIDGKLGINYIYKLSNSKLIFDCGWMWINYFNAFIRQEDSSLVSQNISFDFGLNGIYWGLKWLA